MKHGVKEVHISQLLSLVYSVFSSIFGSDMFNYVRVLNFTTTVDSSQVIYNVSYMRLFKYISVNNM